MMPVARSVASLPVLLLGHRLRRGRLKLFQETRLRRLIAHACRTVPYYRQLFKEAGISPGDIRSLSDLSAIPSTSREDLQQLEAGSTALASIRSAAESVLGPQVRFHIEVVGDIPPEPNGKYRVARSFVASQYD